VPADNEPTKRQEPPHPLPQPQLEDDDSPTLTELRARVRELNKERQ